MKKIASVLFAAILALTMLVSLTACSGKDSSSSSQSSGDLSSQSSQESSSDESESSEASQPSETSEFSEASQSSETSESRYKDRIRDNLVNTGKYAAMEDYVNSQAVQDMVDSMVGSLEEQGIEIVLRGDGDRLIYEYTYQEQIDADTAASALESALAQQSGTFAQVAASLKEVVEVETPVVVVIYRNADGSEIYSQEFTAKS